ncbi:MAG: hypothetical protein J6J00_09715 [Treponema sp.]|nr:hypothetical protein [Treponema sp.]
MKKIITTLLLCSLCALTFAAPKKGKSNNIKLDPKKKFAIEGVELGSLEEAQVCASVNNKGEIIWNQDCDWNFFACGWELRGIDMSKYAGLKFELASSMEQRVRIKVENPACTGTSAVVFDENKQAYVFFNGSNASWHEGDAWTDINKPDPAEGYKIFVSIEAKDKAINTVFKSVELLSKKDYPDADELKILGVPFGSQIWKARIIGNEITWLKGDTGGDAGWNFGGIDLSEYDRVRIEIESNTAAHLGLRICDSEHNNWHGYDNQIEPNVYEADLRGEGASWLGDNAGPLDKSKGLQIFLQTWDRKKEEKTVVKSIQFLKGKRVVNENLMIEGAAFGTCGWDSNVYDGGVIEWKGDDKYAGAGWNVKGVDFSKYKKIRIELSPESANLPLVLRFAQNYGKSEKQLYPVAPNVFEAKLDGSGYDFISGNEKWDDSIGIEEICVRLWGAKAVKAGDRTIIKSVTLLKEDNEIPQPERLVLNGAKLGSKKERAWLDENFAINWYNAKTEYYMCGWKLEKLDGDILEIKVTSTDVPLRLRIREYANSNESSWLDDGTHIFRINLKDKKQESRGSWKVSEWNKMSKEFDFSQGCEIVLEPVNGVFKDGKKTVVEYIKVE